MTDDRTRELEGADDPRVVAGKASEGSRKTTWAALDRALILEYAMAMEESEMSGDKDFWDRVAADGIEGEEYLD